MNYGSVCSGIEAATVAWEPLGWNPLWFAEVDKFCNALLAHRYPRIKNYGDFTRIGPDTGTIDLLCGGTPCQDFSIAGLRAGLDGERGNLTLEFVKLADRLRPRWLVWENVPGVLSVDGGRAFGALLGGLEKLGYGFAYRVLDAQYFGVAQRRRRVFVVGHLGDWRRAAAVLFERQGLCRDTPARSKALSRVARAAEVGPSGGRFTDVAPTLDARCKDGPIRNQIGLIAFGGNNTWGPIEVATACNAHGGSMRMDFETETFCVEVASALLAKSNCSHDESLETYVAHTLRGEGMDASEDGTGRGTPLIPVAFSAKDYGADLGGTAPTLRAMPHDRSHANAGGQIAVAVPDTLLYNGIRHASTPENHTRALLRVLRSQVGEETFAEWGLGVLDSLQPQKVLRPFLHGKGFRFADEPHSGMVHHALSCSACLSSGSVLRLWKIGSAGCPPPEWRPHKQLSRELGESLSKLPYAPSPQEIFLCDLREAGEGIGVLHKALSALQEVGRSTKSEGQPVCSSSRRQGGEPTEGLLGSWMQETPPRARLLRDARAESAKGDARYAVRRLVPAECEALQGLPRNYTLIPYRSKPAADGPRYKAVGNSMAVPVMRWIGERIEAVERMAQ